MTRSSDYLYLLDTIADEGQEHVAESPREGGKVPHCLSPSPLPWYSMLEAENLMSSMTSANCSDFFFRSLPEGSGRDRYDEKREGEHLMLNGYILVLYASH